jgi:hypothetical protein
LGSLRFDSIIFEIQRTPGRLRCAGSPAYTITPSLMIFMSDDGGLAHCVAAGALCPDRRGGPMPLTIT